MAAFGVLAGAPVGAAAAGPASLASKRRRGKTIWPEARPFLNELRCLCIYGSNDSGVDQASLKKNYSICIDYFSSLLDGLGKNETDRRAITEDKVKDVKVSDRKTVEAILAFSDEYELNEYFCLDYYILTVHSDGQILKELESSDYKTKQPGYYNLQKYDRVVEAPRHLYKYEKATMLETLLLFMRMRAHCKNENENNMSGIDQEGQNAIFEMSDIVLNDRDFSNKLIKRIKEKYIQLNTRLTSAVNPGVDHVLSTLDLEDFHDLKYFCTILFYSLHDDENAEKEIWNLQELIILISNDLTKGNEFLLSMDGTESINAWQVPAQEMLVILQLAHVHVIMNLADKILESDYNEHKASKELMNKLLSDLYAEIKGPGSHSAHGMLLLSYAFYVREAPPPPHNQQNAAAFPENFAIFIAEVNDSEACLGTYNYMRLCILPILQAGYHDPKEPFSAIGFIEDTNADFFLVYEQLMDSIAQFSTDTNVHDADTSIIDIANLFSATFTVKPSYSDRFNPNSQEMHANFDDFIINMLERTMLIAGNKLNCVSIHLLAGLAGSSDADMVHQNRQNYASNAQNVYELLNSTATAPNPNSPHFKLTWESFFEFIQRCEEHSIKIQELHEKILISIFTLISTVCYRSPLMAANMLRDYHPIPLMFSLLAKKVSTELKGAILRALASWATIDHQDCREAREEIWNLIESYHLLPTVGVGLEASEKMVQSGLLSMNNSKKMGLLVELEESESKDGVYSITDGFLQLLDALLSHGPQDKLGEKYRPPGIIVFLDYVIEDILVKAKERHFIMGPQGQAQRWRLISRCFKVLINVLQHYPINALSSLQENRNSPNWSQEDEEKLKALEWDFGEETVTYIIQDKPKEGHARMKSAGFFVMSLLLTNTSKLRDILLSSLQECDDAELCESWENNLECTIKQSLKMGEILAQRGPQNKFLDTRLGFYGFDGYICDGSYWRGRTVTTALGLLHECALREGAFLKFFRATPFLTIVRSANGRLMKHQMAVHSLADIFCVQNSALCSIVKVLHMGSHFNTSIPSPPIMAAKLLKKVANDLSTSKLLETMNGQLSNATSNGFQGLQASCLRALRDRKILPVPDRIEKSVRQLGGDIQKTDVYSQELEPVQKPDVVGILDRAHRSNGNSDFETPPEALLNFLLTTLSPNEECLSHMLLGLGESMDSTRADQRWDLLQAGRLLTDGAKKEVSSNCLEVVMDYLKEPSKLLSEQPELACLCFELIHRLCASPITSAIMLSFLRDYEVTGCAEFGQTKSIFIFEHCMNHCLHELKEYSNVGANGDGNNMLLVKQKTSCSTCMGWLLKIGALELRTLGILKSEGRLLIPKLQPFLDLYNDGQPFMGENINRNFLEVIIICAADGQNYVPNVKDDLIARCLSAAAREYRVGRYISENGKDKAAAFTIIDKHAYNKQFFSDVAEANFQDKVDDYKRGLKILVEMNKHSWKVATDVHLAEAWKQFTTVFFTCHCADIIESRDKNVNVDYYLGSNIIPTMEILESKAPGVNLLILEHISSTIFVMVRELCKIPKRSIQGSPLTLFSHAIVSQEVIESMLSHIIKTILQSANGFTQRIGESVKFRGYLYSTLTAILTGLCGFPSPLNLEYSLAKKNTYKAELDGSSSNDIGIKNKALNILEKYAGELADTFGKDICSGFLIWQLTAASTFGNVLAILSFKQDNPGISAALQTIHQNGYLQQMMSIIESHQQPHLSENFINRETDTERAMRTAERETFISHISLFTHIASTLEGAEFLLQFGGILHRLNKCTVFRRAPPSLIGSGDKSENPTGEWATQLLAVLRLLRVIAVTSPSRQVLEGVAEFFTSNLETIIYILRLRIKNLTALQLADCVTCLLALIASAPPAPLRNMGEKGDEQRGNVYLWDELANKFGGSFMTDLCELLRIIGGDPFSKELAQKCGVTGPNCGIYWAEIQPANRATGWLEDERKLCDTIVFNGDDFRHFPDNWNAFDAIKLDLSLKIVSHISTLLRLRTHMAIEQGFNNRSSANGTLIAGANVTPSGYDAVKGIDVESIVTAFLQCSKLSRSVVYNDTGRASASIATTLNFISKNLLTALHDISMIKPNHDWGRGEFEKVINEALVQDPQGNRKFINEVARVMKHKQ